MLFSEYIHRISGRSITREADQPIYKLLEFVSRVFITYSTVGTEAAIVGVPVVIVNIPGKINTSPLLEKSGTMLVSVVDDLDTTFLG